MTTLGDLRHDLAAYGLERWGLFAVAEDGSPRRLDSSPVPPPDVDGWAPGALLLVTDGDSGTGIKDVGVAGTLDEPTTLLEVLRELQVWSMDERGRPTPTAGSLVLDPALDDSGQLVWTARGVQIPVGELPSDEEGLRTRT